MYPIFYMAFTRSLATTHYTNMVSEVNGFLLTALTLTMDHQSNASIRSSYTFDLQEGAKSAQGKYF
jgi:hypothetical protein